MHCVPPENLHSIPWYQSMCHNGELLRIESGNLYQGLGMYLDSRPWASAPGRYYVARK